MIGQPNISKSAGGVIFPFQFTTFPSDCSFGNKINPAVVPDISFRGKELSILLVDDDIDDREMFCEVMEELGLPVKLETAEDGEHLFSILNSLDKLPDLIFLDLNMPNKNGRDCLEEIRKFKHHQHIPVIIYSTSSSKRDIDETFDKGANLYVSKPSSYGDLKKMASHILTLDWEKFKPNSNKKQFVYSQKSK